MTTPDSAVFLQLQQLTEQVGALGEREAAHHQDISGTIGKLQGTDVDQGKALVDLTQKLTHLTKLVGNIAATADGAKQPPREHGQADYGRDGGFGEDGRYQPAPAPQWWRISGEDRDRVLVRLRWWVKAVYRPGYGHLAKQLPDCWDQHDLCLYLVDILSQLHTVLYQAEYGPSSEQEGELLERSPGVLTSAAEWHLRFLPAAVSLMVAETTGCEHQRPQVSGWGNR